MTVYSHFIELNSPLPFSLSLSRSQYTQFCLIAVCVLFGIYESLEMKCEMNSFWNEKQPENERESEGECV